MRQLLVVGNWKMNGSRASVQALLGDLVSAAGVQAGGGCVSHVCAPGASAGIVRGDLPSR